MSLLAGACLAAASCSDSDEDTKLPSPNFPEAVSATIEAGGTYTLEIEPNQNWECPDGYRRMVLDTGRNTESLDAARRCGRIADRNRRGRTR